VNTGWKVAIGIGALLGVRRLIIATVDQKMFRLGNTTNDIVKLKQVIAYFEGRGDMTTANMLRPRLEALQAKDLSLN
jgi:hypothetical protein